ncbi:aminotransferase class V-fold PLP-dependent enzyme [Candidatus Carsonella ruddii]|uniref:Aminotransferase class V-fold PLP-dependent enzyme n=1 Tax=Carsonella ruddii TaxID=114186 RepID=A0AAJ6FDV4_CARRU|nr:aminotransferase class V-fold PLP-dependent enzyme [Candidatus Carsonella ruddii]WGS66708.1 aminotransferase class V-fold PLP-dependent enzyme [Candidatus Carsonella ruddii]WGS66902.1 aminotransferase class V-fold PLP-dependent enzyme [Candidatus Carsonella ruddii]WGS67287.1 aminotransferase class V-fold PLP-dependent enzyme [Candidatus Carsonella ruddii]WMC18303.1 MAG: aminotransferase class V-fold PLP-dependent enzyme [Candidatus Carsonella ruddii]WMC18497.1 MAG: aminotransferase class V-
MFLFLSNFKKTIYFDNSSTNQKPKILFKSIINVLQKKNFNLNRGEYNLLQKNLIFLKKIKIIIKKIINSNFIEEIIFFYNSTFSINFILLNLKNFIKNNNEILISNKEHNSVLIPLLKIFKNKNIKIIVFPIYKNKININIFCNYINSNTYLFINNISSNNFGYINKLKKTIKICNYNNIITIVDATQSISSININLKKNKIDFLFFSFHKLYSLTGVSILYCKIFFLSKLNPILTGGGSLYYNGNKFIFKNFDEKFYFGTQNIFSIYSSYYSLKWFLSNKKYIFFLNFFIKKTIFNIFNKKKSNFSNIILLKNYNNIFFNNYLDINKIISRCDNLCNFLKKMFINKNKNCRLSYNFFNTIKEILKIKFLIFFFNFKIINN